MSPRRRRPGTSELLIGGLPTEIIEEYRLLCKGRGRLGKDLTYGEMFAEMLLAWKSIQREKDSQSSKKSSSVRTVMGSLHLREPGESSKSSQKESSGRG